MVKYYHANLRHNASRSMEETNMKKLLALTLAVLMLAGMAACAKAPAADAASDLAYIQQKGTLVVGITDFAPMDYQDASGEWIGFDADMAKAFAESLGVEVQFVEIDWDSKIMERHDADRRGHGVDELLERLLQQHAGRGRACGQGRGLSERRRLQEFEFRRRSRLRR